MEHKTVVIADDHQMIRDGLQTTLTKVTTLHDIPFTVVAEADNGLAALAAVKQHKPNLIFLDISMPLATGAEIINDITRFSPDTIIVVFTGVVAPGLLATMVESGAHGIFSKTADPDLLVAELPRLLANSHFIAPELLASIEQGRRSSSLTERERQTLNMILSGKSNKEMARLLSISPKTVDKHRTSLMQKLEVHSIAELMARALKDGLIDPH